MLKRMLMKLFGTMGNLPLPQSRSEPCRYCTSGTTARQLDIGQVGIVNHSLRHEVMLQL